MALASLRSALDLLRSPAAWLPGLALGIFAAGCVLLQYSAGLFIAERLFMLELVTFPFFVAGLMELARSKNRSLSSFSAGGSSGYFRVLLPSLVILFGILLTVLLILIPLMALGIAETPLSFMALSVTITILFFTSFYDAAAVIENRGVFDAIRRSVEFVLQHTRDCVVFYLVSIIISFMVFFGTMILWTAALYDRLSPLASLSAIELQTLSLEQFNALIGVDGIIITSLFLFFGLAISVSIIYSFKACLFRDLSEGSPEEPGEPGEYDSKGRWYKY
jgi:uncharacterized membrane protein